MTKNSKKPEEINAKKTPETQETIALSPENVPVHEERGEFMSLLPLKGVVILPKSIIPIIVGREASIQAVEYALKHNNAIFITGQRDPKIETPTISDMFIYGTRSTILQVMRMPNGSLKILAEGMYRSKILATQMHEGFLGVYSADIPTTGLEMTVELEAIWRQLKNLYTAYAKLNDKAPADLSLVAKTPEDMDYLSDTIAVHVNTLSFDERQTILETNNLKDRLLALCDMLSKEIEILETEQRIRGRIQTQVEKSQREYYLTEQMKAIQKELGREDQSAEIAAYQSANTHTRPYCRSKRKS